MGLKSIFNRVFHYVRELIKKFFNDGCTSLAASISYYLFFSVFPIILILIAISGIFLARSGFQEAIRNFIQENIPIITDFALTNVQGIINNAATIGVIGLIFFLYGTSSVFNAIEYAFLKIFGLDRKKMWISKLYGFSIIILILIIVLITVGLSVFFSYLTSSALNIFNINSDISEIIFSILSIIISIIFNFLLFVTIYYFGTARQLSFRKLWLGSLISAFIWEGVKLGFVFYLDKIANYEKIYGSIGSIIAFLFWIYISALILLFGAEIIYFNLKKIKKPG